MWSDSEAGHGNDGAFGRSSVTGSRGGLGGGFAASGGRAVPGERRLRRSLGFLPRRAGGVGGGGRRREAAERLKGGAAPAVRWAHSTAGRAGWTLDRGEARAAHCW